MNKQKLAELAKQLESLVEPDGAQEVVASVDVYKGTGGYIRTTVNIAHFVGDGDESIIIRRHEETIDNVEVTHRYYQTIGAEFTFMYKNDPDTVYTATKSLDKYVVTWDDCSDYDDCTVVYTEDFVERCIRDGHWLVVNEEG